MHLKFSSNILFELDGHSMHLVAVTEQVAQETSHAGQIAWFTTL